MEWSRLGARFSLDLFIPLTIPRLPTNSASGRPPLVSFLLCWLASRYRSSAWLTAALIAASLAISSAVILEMAASSSSASARSCLASVRRVESRPCPATIDCKVLVSSEGLSLRSLAVSRRSSAAARSLLPSTRSEALEANSASVVEGLITRVSASLLATSRLAAITSLRRAFTSSTASRAVATLLRSMAARRSVS